MEDVLIVAIVFSFGAFVCTGIYKLIMARINRTRGIDNDTFDRLAQAFIQHREEINSRVQNIEAIIADDDSLHKIEEPDSQNKNTLHNDLNNKMRIQQ